MKYFKGLLFSLTLLVCFCLPAFSLAGTTVTSNITAQTIIDRVRYDLNETTASFWTDAELVYWINEAVWEIANRTQCLETGVSNIVVKNNTRSYPIVDTSGVSYMAVIKVEYDIGLSGATLDQTQIYDLDLAPFKNLRYAKEKEFGNPKVFAVNNNTLYIWPIPRTDQSGNTLYLYRSLLPTGVTATTSAIETPAYFDNAILYYVEAKALFKQDSVKKATTYFALFEAMTGRNMQTIMKRDIFEEKQ